jgi:hypothetical protein
MLIAQMAAVHEAAMRNLAYAAEDRPEARDRTERLEEQDWRRETDRAKRTGEPAPPPPPRRKSVWPAWPVRAAGEDGSGRRRRNGAAASVMQ